MSALPKIILSPVTLKEKIHSLDEFIKNLEKQLETVLNETEIENALKLHPSYSTILFKIYIQFRAQQTHLPTDFFENQLEILLQFEYDERRNAQALRAKSTDQLEKQKLQAKEDELRKNQSIQFSAAQNIALDSKSGLEEQLIANIRAQDLQSAFDEGDFDEAVRIANVILSTQVSPAEAIFCTGEFPSYGLAKEIIKQISTYYTNAQIILDSEKLIITCNGEVEKNENAIKSNHRSIANYMKILEGLKDIPNYEDPRPKETAAFENDEKFISALEEENEKFIAERAKLISSLKGQYKICEDSINQVKTEIAEWTENLTHLNAIIEERTQHIHLILKESPKTMIALNRLRQNAINKAEPGSKGDYKRVVEARTSGEEASSRGVTFTPLQQLSNVNKEEPKGSELSHKPSHKPSENQNSINENVNPKKNGV